MASSLEKCLEENDLFRNVIYGNYDEVKRLITVENFPVNFFDKAGMTPLQHAAYSGDYNICKLLLDCGADANLTRHSSHYTALMFAGMKGNSDVVRLLLEHGASPSRVNSMNNTAAEMAAFVGKYDAANVIINFIPLEEIEVFTKNDKEPMLSPSLLRPAHELAIKTNIHPVHLVIYIQNNLCILENAKNLINIFRIICKKNFIDEGNELLSLKFHHLAFIINACLSFVGGLKSKTSESGNTDIKEVLNRLIKYWIKGDKSGFPVVLEKLLRQDIKEYPYVECGLFRQLVRTLAPVQIGEEPSAISIIIKVVNGQPDNENYISCYICGEPSAEKKCSACKCAYYCSKNCQKLHWFTHKTLCSTLLKLRLEKESEVKDIDVKQLSNKDKEDS